MRWVDKITLVAYRAAYASKSARAKDEATAIRSIVLAVAPQVTVHVSDFWRFVLILMCTFFIGGLRVPLW